MLNILHNAKTEMAGHGSNVSLATHQAGLVRAFIIASHTFVQERGSLYSSYHLGRAMLRLDNLLDHTDAAKEDLQTHRDSQHILTTKPRRTTQSSWLFSARKPQQIGPVAVAERVEPFGVIRNACVDANEAITAHWKIIDDLYPQTKYLPELFLSDAFRNPAILDDLIKIVEWYKAGAEDDARRFEQSRANRTHSALVKA